MKPKVVILSGLIQSGKSTTVMEWIRGKNVGGFLTPTLDGRKVFYAIAAGTYHPYELEKLQEDSVVVGRFILDGAAFTLARELINESLNSCVHWIVLDEIGLLELQNKGHHLLFQELLARSKSCVLVLVRSSLVAEVIAKYGLTDSSIISVSNLNELL